jgi:acyl-CoA synthetase (AMP-forming)/AMP-acid ligase II
VGGRVAILALNSDRYLEMYYAVAWAGGIVVPINIRLAPAEIIYTLNDSGATILAVDQAFSALLPALSGKLETGAELLFLGNDPAPAGMHGYEALLAAAEPVPDSERAGDDLAGIFYTGGTTGQPKGVMLTHSNLIAQAMNGFATIHWDEKTVYLHAAPMFHLADTGSTFSLTMCGGCHTFIPKFDPADVLEAIQAYRVSSIVLVPVMITMLVNFPAVQNYDLSSLELIIYGGSPMPEAVIARCMEIWPGCGFVQAYGMTELSSVATLLEPRYHTLGGPLAGKLRSAGRPVHSVALKIVDPADQELPNGAIGEIAVRGPNVTSGYWNKPEASAQALRGGWMHTGDAGFIDDEGFVYVVDRLKDMIVSGGENVYSAEVEQAIYQHPSVAMCAVIGVPSDDWGEAVHAIVVLRQGHQADASAIIAHCKGLIAGYKCPRTVDIRWEPLPISGAGKVLKRELRRPFWEGHTRQVH